MTNQKDTEHNSLVVEIRRPPPNEGEPVTVGELARWVRGTPIGDAGGGGTFSLPARFSAGLVDAGRKIRLDLEIVVTDRPRVARAVIDATDALTSSDIRRLPWHSYIDEACAAAGGTITEAAGDGWTVRPISGDEAAAAVQEAKKGRRRRRPVSDDLLSTVATLYRAALADDQLFPVGRFVHEGLTEQGLVYSEKYVRQLVQKARQRGFLGPTTERRAGEEV